MRLYCFKMLPGPHLSLRDLTNINRNRLTVVPPSSSIFGRRILGDGFSSIINPDILPPQKVNKSADNSLIIEESIRSITVTHQIRGAKTRTFALEAEVQQEDSAWAESSSCALGIPPPGVLAHCILRTAQGANRPRRGEPGFRRQGWPMPAVSRQGDP